MRRYNRTYRGIDTVTDVLAFPALDPSLMVAPGTLPRHLWSQSHGGDTHYDDADLGDIALCPAVIEADAAELGVPTSLHTVCPLPTSIMNHFRFLNTDISFWMCYSSFPVLLLI